MEIQGELCREMRTDQRSAVVVTVSDRSFEGSRTDTGGPALVQILQEAGWDVIDSHVVPDEVREIERILLACCNRNVALVVTTGGTGLGPRDITPEATKAVITREVPGIAEAIRRRGEADTPLSVLSRGVCGAREATLILNLPGSPKGAAFSLRCVLGVLPHAVAIIRSPYFDHEGMDLT